MDTDFSSLERELRGDDGTPEIPAAYADLAEEADDDRDGDDYRENGNYQRLRKSG